MIYTDEYGNQEELAPYTLALSEKFTEAAKLKNDREGIAKKYDALRAAISQDYLDTVLNTNKIEEMDIVRLVDTFNRVKMAYEEPMTSGLIESAMKTLDEIMPMLEKVERITANSSAKPTRQQFTRIK